MNGLKLFVTLVRHCCILIVALCAWPDSGFCAVRVAVLPFEINAEENLSYLQQALPQMLATRLESRGEVYAVEKPLLQQYLAPYAGKKVTEEAARRIGADMGAEFVILGSLTKIGDQVSIDATLINTQERVPLQRFYSAADTVAGIPAKINELAQSLYFKILGKEVINKIVISGNKYIEQDAIMLSVASKPGDVFSPEQLQDDLKRIYQMGYFDDVKGVKR